MMHAESSTTVPGPFHLLGPLFLAAIVAGCTGSDPASNPTPAVAAERSGRLTFTVEYPMPANAHELRLWLPYVTSNDHQTVTSASVDGNFAHSQVYYEPVSDSVVLYGEWIDPPGGVATLTYAFDITSVEMLRSQFPAGEPPMPTHALHYLGATSLGPVTGKVPNAAQQITVGKETVLEKARALYDYIIDAGERDNDVQGCGVGDVDSLLDNLSGKCVDLSSVFVALARSIGIPAREVFGTRIATAGDITGSYHCRAEFYLPGYNWVPVDPSDVRKLMLNEELSLDDPRVQEAREYYFGRQTETYVDFYSGRDIVLNPTQASAPLNYFMYPYAEVDGEALGLFAIYNDSLSVTFEPN